MISIISEPEKIINGETLKIKLDISGKVNLSTYKNMYFNLIIKKNGGTHGNIILYPLKFIGCPLEWEVNPYSYTGSDGTFNVSCTLQNSSVSICSTTFIVEPICAVEKACCSNNITGLLHNINLRKGIVKKQEEKPEYLKSFQVQKPELVLEQQEITYKEKEIEKKLFNPNNELTKTNLISTAKVQKAFRNC
jgi:hypothetical protein